ncbi:sigma-70 family RNA polymerase sigma factor [Halobacteriales archaeon Cl-PHB]
MATEHRTLDEFQTTERPPLHVLTPAERDAFEAVEMNGRNGRQYARDTGRSWGTVSNLLMRARDKLAAEAWSA